MKMFFLDAVMLVCLYFPATCKGEPFQLGEVSMQGKHFFEGSRNPMITQGLPGSQLKNEMNLRVNTVVLDYLYFNNRIHSQTDQRQFRVVGWDFQVGLTVFEQLDFEYGHFSQHWLDARSPYEFPVEDYIGFKFYFNRPNPPQNRRLIGDWK